MPLENAVRQLAVFLHKNFCMWNHTDGCGWYYESDLDEKPRKGVSEEKMWECQSHKRWLEKAREVADFWRNFHFSEEEASSEHCLFCGKTKEDCHGGGFDDGIPAHDFRPGGLPASPGEAIYSEIEDPPCRLCGYPRSRPNQDPRYPCLGHGRPSSYAG